MAEVFQKRSGTSDSGRTYEQLYIANLVLRLVTDENVENFHLSSDDASFGCFDDVVVEIKYKNSHKETFAIQLKHKENKVLRNNDLIGSRGDFAIAKYFQSFLEISGNCQDVKMIVLTNSRADIGKTLDLNLNDRQIGFDVSNYQQEDLVAISEKGRCWKLHPKDEKNFFPNFFQNFFLYTNQTNVSQLETNLKTFFCGVFSSESWIFNEYCKFISKWIEEKGTKYKLDKAWMSQAITLCILSSVIKSLTINDKVLPDKSQTFREAISKFHITLLKKENFGKIRHLWQDSNCNLDDEETKKVKKKFQIDKQDVCKLLWLLGKCPLVVPNCDQVHAAINLCKTKKFIILTDDENLDNLPSFRYLSDLENEEVIYRKILTDYTFSLEGQKEAPLKILIEMDPKFKKKITTNELVQMIEGSFLIGSKRELPPCHIPRTLSKILINLQCFKKIKNSTVLIDQVENPIFFKKKFANFLVVDLESWDNIPEESESLVIYIDRRKCSQEDCQKIKTPKKQNHHFRYLNQEAVEWISSSDIKEIQKFRLDFENQENNICEEELFENSENSINVICTTAGMGKSTLMTSLKINSSSSFWTLVVYARNHALHFRKEDSEAKFRRYIFEDSCEKYDSFEKEILQMFMLKNKIRIVWDGLDEVTKPTLKKILPLVKAFSQKGVQQWITSRKDLKEDLERTLQTFSRRIKQFNEDEQKEYVKKRLNLSETQALKTFQTIKINMEGFSNDILGIPLQIFMLTELLYRDERKYLNLLKHHFTILDLYEYFIEEKFDIYNREIKRDLKIDKNYEDFKSEKESTIAYFEKVAFKLYFDKYCCRISKCCSNDEFLEDIKTCGDPVGFISVVTKDGVPEFIHNSYGEYFAALYLFHNNKCKTKNYKFIVNKNYTNIRFFLDLMLVRDCRTHMAVMCQNYSLLENVTEDDLTNTRDEVGRDALELACAWSRSCRISKIQKNPQGYFTVDQDNIGSEENVKNLKYKYVVKHFGKINSSTNFVVKKILLFLPFLIPLYSKSSNRFDDEAVGTMLYYAIKYDHVVIFDFLDNFLWLKEIYRRFKQKDLLFVAIANKALKCLERFLTKKQYMETLEKNIHVALKACTSDFEEVFGLLETYLPNLNKLLHVACEKGTAKNVEFLISKGAVLNSLSENNQTPMHFACLNEENGFNIVNLLIERGGGGNVDAVDVVGRRPVHFACQIRSGLPIVDLLFSQECRNVNVSDLSGQTCLHFSTRAGVGNIVRFLISEGVEVDAVDAGQRTALHYGCQSSTAEIVSFLLENGADIGKTDVTGRTPLHYACANIHFGLEIVRLLVSRHADVEIQDKNGRRPLHEACRNRNFGEEMVKILVEKDADVNAADNCGMTPLHLAAMNSGLKAAVILIKNKARIDVEDRGGRIPLYYARAAGSRKLENLLQSDFFLPLTLMLQ